VSGHPEKRFTTICLCGESFLFHSSPRIHSAIIYNLIGRMNYHSPAIAQPFQVLRFECRMMAYLYVPPPVEPHGSDDDATP
jgi:hypothetical protein